MKYIYIALATILICFSVSWGGPPLLQPTGVSNSTVQAGTNITVTSTAGGVRVATTNTPAFYNTTLSDALFLTSTAATSTSGIIFGAGAGDVFLYRGAAGLLQTPNSIFASGNVAAGTLLRTSASGVDGGTSSGANLLLQSTAHATGGTIIVRGKGTQPVDILQVQNSASSVLMNVTSAGAINAASTISGTPGTGELYYHDHVTPLAMGGSTAFTNITGLTNGVQSGDITRNGAAGTFTVTVTGLYHFHFTSSPKGTNGDTVAISAGVNGTVQDKCDNHRKLGSVDVGSHATQCVLSLTAGQAVTAMVNSAGANTVNYETLNINLKRLN